jgi:deoxyuridine 5'-triphosphate nucleotidohydrolase
MSTANNPVRVDLTAALQVKKLSPTATIPTRGSPYSAGFDLSADEEKVIPAGGRGVVATGLSIACPPGTYARIAPRSGLAVKRGIDCGAGVVDADYRGPVGVVLFNFGAEDFVVEVGDRIAQLILEKVNMAPVAEVEELAETARGAGGFGSTGVSLKENDTKKQRTISPSPNEPSS